MLGFGTCIAGIILGSHLQAAYPTPALYYDFNTSGGAGNEYVSSSNSTQSLDFRMYGYNNGVEWKDSLSPAGGGVSGALGDRSLDLTSATGMGGTTNQGGGAYSVGGLNTVGFSGAKSFTVAGWFYATEEVLNVNAQLINVSNGDIDGFRLSGASGGNLQFDYVGSDSRGTYTTSSGSWSAVGEWVFFAMVLDTTITEGNNLFFYVGSIEDGVTLAHSARSTRGSLVIGSRSVTMGNFTGSMNPATNRPFQGYIDNVAFWVDAEGSGGALSLEQLDAFRASAIPEPGSVAMGMGILILACALLRRRVLSRK